MTRVGNIRDINSIDVLFFKVGSSYTNLLYYSLWFFFFWKSEIFDGNLYTLSYAHRIY